MIVFTFLSTVGPKLIKVPDRFLLIHEGTTAAVTCEAFSYPPSVITWARAFTALPKGRTSVRNGTLSIEKFTEQDSGAYVCTAKNKLGSVTAVATFGFQKKHGKFKSNTISYCSSLMIFNFNFLLNSSNIVTNLEPSIERHERHLTCVRNYRAVAKNNALKHNEARQSNP